MAVVVFDYYAWQARFPELATSVPDGLAAAYFEEAGGYLDNTDGSRVTHVGTRTMLLNLLVAHIAALNGAGGAGGDGGQVGRISSASEGSVSVSFQYDASAGEGWFAQTRYGATFWRLTAWMRTARYIAGRQPVFDRWGTGRGAWGGPFGGPWVGPRW